MQSIPSEMVVPPIQAWVKQSSRLLGLRIYSENVRSLVIVTTAASQSEIAENGLAAMLTSDDMVNGEHQT
jgi:hypothetical protein